MSDVPDMAMQAHNNNILTQREEATMIYKGGMSVKQGTYWDIKCFSRINAARDSILPGDGDRHYIRASTVTMLTAGPLIGLLFAVCLPFAGIAMAIHLFIRRVLKGAAGTVAKTFLFRWKPSNAYFAGSKKKEDIQHAYRNVDDILAALNGGRKDDGDPNDPRG